MQGLNAGCKEVHVGPGWSAVRQSLVQKSSQSCCQSPAKHWIRENPSSILSQLRSFPSHTALQFVANNTSLINWLPERTRGRPWGRLRIRIRSIEKRQVGSFILLHKISRTACCFGIRTFLKQYSCYESATNWYTDHQYLAQYSDIINNLQEIPLIFCNYAVRSCGTWRKGPGQSPCNGLSISDLELYVTETNTGVCDPVTD